MAKKKKTVKRSKGKRSTKSKTGDFVNLMKIGGMAAVAFGKPKLDELEFIKSLDPKLKAAGYIVLGEYLPKNSSVKGMIKDESLARGAGDALIYEGVKELMTSFGIAGINEHSAVLAGDDELAVAIEGLNDDDLDTVNGDDDLDAVNGDDDDDLLSGDDDDDLLSGDDDELASVNGDDDDLM